MSAPAPHTATQAPDLGTMLPQPAISLPDLMAAASLQARTDRKYLLPLAAAIDLLTLDLRQAEPDARVLEIDGTRSFGYASHYLDTPDLAAYRLAAHGRGNRYKVRTRTYLDSGEEWLEVKTRDPRGTTIKDRLPLALADRRETRTFAPRTVEERTGHHVDQLEAALDVTYRRATLFLPSTSSRVTVDTDLAWRSPDGVRRRLPDHAIVETKTTGRACAVDHLLWRSGIRPRRLSKYTCGLALLRRDELPTNRWHRTIAALDTLSTWS